MALRALIVDDNETFLETARVILEREGIVVDGVAASGAEAHRLARVLRPDVALVDIDLGGESGFEVARDLVADLGSDVILISTHAEDDFADLIAESPAVGFLAKSRLSGGAIREMVGPDPSERATGPRGT
jgi:two-component system, NarL family, nitrate/nitrite response regulator NarL